MNMKASGQPACVARKRKRFTYTIRLHFVKFETKFITDCLNFIAAHSVNIHEDMTGKSIKVTGGGVDKHTDLIQEKLGLLVDEEDELACLIKGCNYLLKNVSDEAFIYHRNGNPKYEFQTAHTNISPYLLMKIGSWVSIMKVRTGSGTFWVLGLLLTKAKGFDELLKLAEKGEHRHVDFLISDICGGDCKVLSLPGDVIASSFGRVLSKS
ncbi:hypothetical protein V9T40_013308 [Parthenolecanium corni]|uniref:Uncharacterized protein n=1 Tax=Parthenolecanium corni TaxID=536013 RepID=A0AAN9Y512_9HEMI